MITKLIFLIALILPILSKYERIITTLKYSKFRVKPAIVNGAVARSGQLPYLVSIKEAIQKISVNKTVWSNICGGSIIGQAKVLTAAHCFEPQNFYFSKHPEKLRVVAGSLNRDLTHSGETETTSNAQWRKVIHITIHNHYNFPSNDIAIAFTNLPWNFTGGVNCIQPARKATDYTKFCLSAGFGQTGRTYLTNVSQVLMWAEIEVFSKIQCNVLWDMDMDTFICTNSVATDVAGGDSGGPLACFGTNDPKDKQNRDQLVGIVSGKNFDRTTLFTRVSAFDNWLLSNLGNRLKGGAVVGVCCAIKFVCIFLSSFILLIVSFDNHILTCKITKFQTGLYACQIS